ncbi:MAG: sigma-70 family RNA polymerase sigma factor [Actinomycetales bacterium]
MDDHEFLARRFEQDRGHLQAVAFRVLGSRAEADDAVQEAWLRLSRSDTSEIANLTGWLTTVVSRVCLDMLRSRRARREDPLDLQLPGHGPAPAAELDAMGPEGQAVQADSVGLALLVVLETLTPAERLAFVLHDLFAMPFDEIAPIVDRSPDATRQLASRARRRVQGVDAQGRVDRVRQQAVVDAFLAASREGRFDDLLALLDPEAVVHADAVAVSAGAEAEVRGAEAVARTFAGRARHARTAYIDGVAGAVWFMDGTPRVVFRFRIDADKVTGIDLVMDPARIGELDLEPVG